MNDLIDNIWEKYFTTGNQRIFGLDFKDGAEVNRIETAEINSALYQFPAFMPWKLYLSMANEAEKLASVLCTKLGELAASMCDISYS